MFGLAQNENYRNVPMRSAAGANQPFTRVAAGLFVLTGFKDDGADPKAQCNRQNDRE
jgi:hypothetical protein